MTQNTQQERWEIKFDELWGGYPQTKEENAQGLDALIKSFIRTVRAEAAEEAYARGYRDGAMEAI